MGSGIARTRIQLLSVRQYHRLSSVLDADEHIAVKTAYLSEDHRRLR